MLHSPANLAFRQDAFTAQAPVVTHIDAALAEEWKALAEQVGEPNSYAEYWFVSAALRHLRGDDIVRLAVVRDETGELVGILPLVTGERYGRLPVATLSNWVHLQCYNGGPLIRTGCEVGFWTSLFDLLDRSDWAGKLLTLRLVYADGPVRQGLDMATKIARRDYHVAQSYDRALLASDVDPETYIERTVRSKKRKEFRRQAKRLAELGAVKFEQLGWDDAIMDWCDQYLELEACGWKGEEGTALGADTASAAFFRETMRDAHALGRVDFLRLTLDDRPIAMLINLRSPPMLWSYKITYDESLARFSPGVLIELETIAQIMRDPKIARADSCAKPDHPMINKLWGERQSIEQLTISLKGPTRRSAYFLCRSVDQLGASIRRKWKREYD